MAFSSFPAPLLFSRSPVWLFATSWTAVGQASLSFTISQSLLKLMALSQWCYPTTSSSIVLPLTFPSIRVFSNELALHIRWPKYWSFSFRSSPSNEYSGLISRPLAFFFLKISWWLAADFRILLNVYFREWNPLHFPYQQIMWFHSLSHRLRCLGMLLFITQGHVLLHRTPRGSTQKGAVNIWR